MSKPIDPVQAKRIIELRINLFEPVAKLISSIAGNDTDIGHFYGSINNAFLFDRETVLKHFFKDLSLIDQNSFTNTHLQVIVGSHDQNETITELINEVEVPVECKKGAPTIIIAGVNENKALRNVDPQKKIYEFTFEVDPNKDKPGDQYPPAKKIVKLEKFYDDDNRSLTFTYNQ